MGNIFNPRVFVAVGAAAIVACLAAGTRTSNVPYVDLPYDGLAAGMGVLAGCLLLGAVDLHVHKESADEREPSDKKEIPD